MKTATLLAAAWMALAGLPLLAQQADTTALQNTTVTMAANMPESANASAGVDLGQRSQASRAALLERLMRPVSVELMGKLDSKSAKAGDAVELRTRESITTADGTAIPKGTKIMGHVISVEAHGKSRADSEVALQFDRAELRGSQNLAILSQIRWITPSPTATLAASTPGQDTIVNGTQVMGSSHMGGLGGGFAGGTVIYEGRIVDSSKLPQGSNWVANYGLGPAGQATGKAGDNDAAGFLAASEPLRPHPTGIPGVMLADDASGKTSGIFSATGQNVRLDGGARLVLDILPVKK